MGKGENSALCVCNLIFWRVKKKRGRRDRGPSASITEYKQHGEGFRAGVCVHTDPMRADGERGLCVRISVGVC